MPNVTQLSQADLERLIDSKLAAIRSAEPAPANLRGEGDDQPQPQGTAPQGSAWRGSVNPMFTSRSSLTPDSAKMVLDFFRATGQRDTKGVENILRRSGMSGERLQQIGVLADGGYTTPEQFNSEVLIELPKLTPFADPNIVRIVPMSKETMRWTKVKTKPAGPAYVAEGGTYGETGVKFSPITLVAKKIGEIIPFTEEVLESNEISMVQVIAQLVAEQFAYKYNTLITSGAGDATEPEGVLTNANIAAPTWTATNDETKADSLFEIFHGLKSQYRSDAIWMMNDTIIKLVRKLKDANKRYLWQDGFGAQPSTLLGRPVFENPDQLNTTILFGNFKRGYVVGKKSGMQTSQDSSGADWKADIVNFKFRERWDGRVHDESAFVKAVSVS